MIKLFKFEHTIRAFVPLDYTLIIIRNRHGEIFQYKENVSSTYSCKILWNPQTVRANVKYQFHELPDIKNY